MKSIIYKFLHFIFIKIGKILQNIINLNKKIIWYFYILYSTMQSIKWLKEDIKYLKREGFTEKEIEELIYGRNKCQLKE